LCFPSDFEAKRWDGALNVPILKTAVMLIFPVKVVVTYMALILSIRKALDKTRGTKT
jgi:hypothetical protein